MLLQNANYILARFVLFIQVKQYEFIVCKLVTLYI